MNDGKPGRVQQAPHVRRFAVIGDVHGCLAPLRALLKRLGGHFDERGCLMGLSDGRLPVFVGDFADRGEQAADVLRLVMEACTRGQALAVIGNHDDKLLRALRGHAVTVNGELRDTLASLARAEAEAPGFTSRVASFLGALPHQLLLDDGAALVVHAAAPERLQMRSSGEMRRFALYGDDDGTMDPDGHPVRRDWGAAYQGERHVLHGHVKVPYPQWRNRTVDVDTGCHETGILTAVLWPERTFVQVRLTRPPAPAAATMPDPSAGTAPDRLP